MSEATLQSVDLEEDEQSQLADDIARVADQVIARKLEAPFIFLLEAHRPVRSLVYHGTIACGPLFAPFFGASNIDTLLRIMEREEHVEALIRAVEERSKK